MTNEDRVEAAAQAAFEHAWGNRKWRSASSRMKREWREIAKTALAAAFPEVLASPPTHCLVSNEEWEQALFGMAYQDIYGH